MGEIRGVQSFRSLRRERELIKVGGWRGKLFRAGICSEHGTTEGGTNRGLWKEINMNMGQVQRGGMGGGGLQVTHGRCTGGALF